MGYRVRVQTKVLRRRHIIDIDYPVPARQVKDWLGQVPDTAIFQTANIDGDEGTITLEFLEEIEDVSGAHSGH